MQAALPKAVPLAVRIEELGVEASKDQGLAPILLLSNAAGPDSLGTLSSAFAEGPRRCFLLQLPKVCPPPPLLPPRRPPHPPHCNCQTLLIMPQLELGSFTADCTSTAEPTLIVYHISAGLAISSMQVIASSNA